MRPGRVSPLSLASVWHDRMANDSFSHIYALAGSGPVPERHEVYAAGGVFGSYSGTIHSMIVPLGSRRETVQDPPRLIARSEMFRRP